MKNSVFSKEELIDIRNILIKNSIFSCDKLKIAYDAFNSGNEHHYYIIMFLKQEKQLKLGFITKHLLEIDELEKQLSSYFQKRKKIIVKDFYAMKRGSARREVLTPERRREIAQNAVKTRWKKYKERKQHAVE